MLEGLTEEILAGIVLFISGVFLAKPITTAVEEWRISRKLKKLKPIRVKVFFICCNFCSDGLRLVLLRQNQKVMKCCWLSTKSVLQCDNEPLMFHSSEVFLEKFWIRLFIFSLFIK